MKWFCKHYTHAHIYTYIYISNSLSGQIQRGGVSQKVAVRESHFCKRSSGKIFGLTRVRYHALLGLLEQFVFTKHMDHDALTLRWNPPCMFGHSALYQPHWAPRNTNMTSPPKVSLSPPIYRCPDSRPPATVNAADLERTAPRNDHHGNGIEHVEFQANAVAKNHGQRSATYESCVSQVFF